MNRYQTVSAIVPDKLPNWVYVLVYSFFFGVGCGIGYAICYWIWG